MKPHDRAYRYVCRLVDSGAFETGRYLPGVRALAKECAVSMVTMHRALRALTAKGILQSDPRRGYRIAQRPGRHACKAKGSAGAGSDTCHGKASSAVAERIERDIIRGLYPPDSMLPYKKTLCIHYGTSHYTLSDAIDLLLESRRLVPYKRGYRVRCVRVNKAHARIVFFCKARLSDVFGDQTPRAQEIWTELEHQCVKRGIALDVRVFEEYARVQERDTGDDAVLGYVVRNPDIDAWIVERLFSSLARTRKPIAIVDETGQLPHPDRYAVGRRTSIFSIAHSGVEGADMADHLFQKKHRHLAYFSPYKGELWTMKRYAGIADRYGPDVPKTSVTPFFLDEFPDTTAMTDTVLAAGSCNRLAALFERTVSAIDPQALYGTRTLHRSTAFNTVVHHFVAGRMQPLFERALRDKRITAWMCAYDQIGIAALNYLRSMSIDVPRRMAVVGFDDTYEAVSHGLTSYNFNVPALVQAIIDSIVDGSRARGGTRHGPVTIPGLVVGRLTS